MPPKIVFKQIEDDIIREIFGLRDQNNWSNSEIERQFRQRSSRSISFRTLFARLNLIYINQPSDNNIKNEVISVNSLNQEITIFDQPENTADITSEIEHSLSILKVDESNSNTDDSDEVISTHNSEQTNFTNSETALARPRGRPVGSRNKKKKTPSKLEEDLRRKKVNQLKIRQARVNSQLNHRENLIPLAAENTRTRRENGTPDRTLNYETVEAQRQRERRANETIEQTNNRRKRDAQRQRERRASETPEENERRLQQQKDYMVRTRKKKTEERLNRK